MFARLAGAIVRAGLIGLLVLTPALLLPGTPRDSAQIVSLLALIAGLLTFVEYSSIYPTMIEFRDAPPYNRTRFLVLFLTVFMLTAIVRDPYGATTLTMVIKAIGFRLATFLDFPFSPVRLMVLMLPESAPESLVTHVRTAAGVAYLISAIALSIFVLSLRYGDWPGQNGFNVWTNLPNFDPTAGGDVVDRLNRDSQVNLILGFLLPFMIPALVTLTSRAFDPMSLADPHTLIWMITAWAYLPFSLLLRGIAMNRVAMMIAARRREVGEAALQLA